MTADPGPLIDQARDPEADGRDLAAGRVARLLDRVDGDVEQGRLVETGQPTAERGGGRRGLRRPRRRAAWSRPCRRRWCAGPASASLYEPGRPMTRRPSTVRRPATRRLPRRLRRGGARAPSARAERAARAPARRGGPEPRVAAPAAGAPGCRRRRRCACGGSRRRVLKCAGDRGRRLAAAVARAVHDQRPDRAGQPAARRQAALTSGGNMLTSTDTVLIIGTDQRPTGLEGAGREHRATPAAARTR